MVNAWGLLPLALGLVWFISQRLTRIIFADAGFTERAAGAVVIGMALVHLSVGWLATAAVLSRATLLALLVVAAVVLALLTRRSHAVPWPSLDRASTLVLALIAGLAAFAVITARILPVWQWDSIGYHLPFVQFVLQTGSFEGVPRDVRYISTYPHNIELAMVFIRAMLPDDRLVDLAQLPFGLGAATLTAAIARRLGAPRALSLLAAAGWLCAPGVFLQLPTNYVDVGTATTLLGALFFLVFSKATGRSLLIGGIALGLFLGSKPSAPMATVCLGLLTCLKAAHARQWKALLGFAVATLVFGGEMYGLMTLRHGNPVWPVEVHLGPITLPGESTVDDLLAAGAATPRAQGSWLQRLTLSWLAIDSQPVFDMRLGGFGLLFLGALPVALLGVVRRRGGWLGAALLITLISPDPGVTRYVLAFAAVLFAAALAEFAASSTRVKAGLVAVVMLVGAGQVWWAIPGLTGDGPGWLAFWSMTETERRESLGPDGRPDDYVASWAKVHPGESVAFDVDFELPGLLWAADLNYPVHLLPNGTRDELVDWLDARRVRLLAVGPQHEALVTNSPQWEKLFDCHSGPCAVYLRRTSEAQR